MRASDIVSNLALLDALLAKEKEIETFQAQIETTVSNHFETLMRELVGIKRLVLTELAAIKTAVIPPQEPEDEGIYDELVDV
jgi:hypothetical protein